MKAASLKFKTVDKYFSTFPAAIQNKLQKIRSTIKKAAPEAEEVISYNMPAFKLNGMLVFYAAYKEHIGFYPSPSGVEEFRDEIAPYEAGKGTLQFSLEQPIPFELITRVVHFRAKENLEKAKSKMLRKK